MSLDRKWVTHTVATSAQPGVTGLSEGEGDPRSGSQRATTHRQPAPASHTEKRIHSTQKAPESQIHPVQPGKDSTELSITSFSVVDINMVPSYILCLKIIREMVLQR